MFIKVNTGAIVDASKSIAAKNRSINDDFKTVRNAMNRLQRNWSGSAADQASQKFTSLDRTFYENRYQVINDFVNLLNNQAGNAYEVTEKAISGAAAAFK